MNAIEYKDVKRSGLYGYLIPNNISFLSGDENKSEIKFNSPVRKVIRKNTALSGLQISYSIKIITGSVH